MDAQWDSPTRDDGFRTPSPDSVAASSSSENGTILRRTRPARLDIPISNSLTFGFSVHCKRGRREYMEEDNLRGEHKLGDSSPCDDGFCTPLPLSPDSVATPSPPPSLKRNRHHAMYTAATPSLPATPIKLIDILHWLEERCERYLEESRRWQRSEEALEAQRIRKMQILMSLR